MQRGLYKSPDPNKAICAYLRLSFVSAQPASPFKVAKERAKANSRVMKKRIAEPQASQNEVLPIK